MRLASLIAYGLVGEEKQNADANAHSFYLTSIINHPWSSYHLNREITHLESNFNQTHQSVNIDFPMETATLAVPPREVFYDPITGRCCIKGHVCCCLPFPVLLNW